MNNYEKFFITISVMERPLPIERFEWGYKFDFTKQIQVMLEYETQRKVLPIDIISRNKKLYPKWYNRAKYSRKRRIRNKYINMLMKG